MRKFALIVVFAVAATSALAAGNVDPKKLAEQQAKIEAGMREARDKQQAAMNGATSQMVNGMTQAASSVGTFGNKVAVPSSTFNPASIEAHRRPNPDVRIAGSARCKWVPIKCMR